MKISSLSEIECIDYNSSLTDFINALNEFEDRWHTVESTANALNDIIDSIDLKDDELEASDNFKTMKMMAGAIRSLQLDINRLLCTGYENLKKVEGNEDDE